MEDNERPNENDDNEDDLNSAYSYGTFIDKIRVPIREMDSDMEDDENYSADEMDDDTDIIHGHLHQESDRDEEEMDDDEEYDEILEEEEADYGEENDGQESEKVYFSGIPNVQKPIVEITTARK